MEALEVIISGKIISQCFARDTQLCHLITAEVLTDEQEVYLVESFLSSPLQDIIGTHQWQLFLFKLFLENWKSIGIYY